MELFCRCSETVLPNSYFLPKFYLENPRLGVENVSASKVV
jgi:hypothetical protein